MERTDSTAIATSTATVGALPARIAFRATLAVSSLLVLIAAFDIGGFRADFL